MKHALVILSLCAIVALLVELVRLRETQFSKWAWFFLLSQFFYMSACWVAAAKFGWDSKQYASAYYLTMGFVCVVGLGLAWKFSQTIPRTHERLATIEVTASFVIIVCWNLLVSVKHAGMLNRFSFAHILCAGIMVFVGAEVLASMSFPAGLVDDVLRGFVGAYYLAQGLYSLSEPFLYLRGRALLVAKMSITPLVISSVLFCLMALVVRSYQREASRQSLSADIVEGVR